MVPAHSRAATTSETRPALAQGEGGAPSVRDWEGDLIQAGRRRWFGGNSASGRFIWPLCYLRQRLPYSSISMS